MAQETFVKSVLTTRMRMQLNTLLFAKTLVRKDVATSTTDGSDSNSNSKAGIIALMSSDVDRTSDLADGIYDITGTESHICFES